MHAPQSSVYRVKKGDTLSGIALREYGTAAVSDSIAHANNLSRPYVILIGMLLRLPAVPRQPVTSAIGFGAPWANMAGRGFDDPPARGVQGPAIAFEGDVLKFRNTARLPDGSVFVVDISSQLTLQPADALVSINLTSSELELLPSRGVVFFSGHGGASKVFTSYTAALGELFKGVRPGETPSGAPIFCKLTSEANSSAITWSSTYTRMNGSTVESGYIAEVALTRVGDFFVKGKLTVSISITKDARQPPSSPVAVPSANLAPVLLKGVIVLSLVAAARFVPWPEAVAILRLAASPAGRLAAHGI